MKPNLPSYLLAAAVSFGAFAAPALGQNATTSEGVVQQEDNAEARINLSGKLRMLSQVIPAATCQLSSAPGSETFSAYLDAAVNEFDLILNALEFGDEDLQIIAPETRRKTLVGIAELRESWAPMKISAEAVLSGQFADEDLSTVFTQNDDVLARAQNLVTEVTADYANPAEMVSAESFLINIAGRQRMLIQAISTDSCLLSNGLATPETSASLESSIQFFEASLEALRFGAPSSGIRRPPTAQIAAGLEEVHSQWMDVKPVIASTLAGAELDADTSKQKFQDLNAMMVTMNGVVDMYAKSTE